MNQNLSSLYVKIQTLSTKISELTLQNMCNWENESLEYISDKIKAKWSYIKMEENNKALLTMREHLTTYQDKLNILLLKEQKCKK